MHTSSVSGLDLWPLVLDPTVVEIDTNCDTIDSIVVGFALLHHHQPVEPWFEFLGSQENL